MVALRNGRLLHTSAHAFIHARLFFFFFFSGPFEFVSKLIIISSMLYSLWYSGRR